MIRKATLAIICLLHFHSFSQTSCLPEGITFITQEEIGNFQVNYPGCTEIEGNVIISGGNISNLDGLSDVTVIDGDLLIKNNSNLSETTDLKNLTALNGNLEIRENPTLVSLIGVENIIPQSIQDLTIINNTVLKSCNAKSIWDYLADPFGTVLIDNNALGCNNSDEVKNACETGDIKEDHRLLDWSISYNPSGSITVKVENPSNNLGLGFYNVFGQEIHSCRIFNGMVVIDVSGWQRGICLAVLYEDHEAIGQVKFLVP